MIVEAFLRWTETARATDRAQAASALARAFLTTDMRTEEKKAAGMAMTYLLDDPSPKVRLRLAEALAHSQDAPRGIILALAEDQPEIACMVITHSPVLDEADLVDLAGRGCATVHGLVASRPDLTLGAAAAIAEIGDEAAIRLLLENDSAQLSRISLRRMAERFGDMTEIRNNLLDREELPADARHMLVGHVTRALLNCGLVQATMARGRIDRVGREAGKAATVAIAAIAGEEEIFTLVDHLRRSGELTPAFLIHALCLGKADFVAVAVAQLSGLGERRVRPILATGRVHAVRALFESCGLDRQISEVFAETVFLWRDAAAGRSAEDICGRLLESLADRKSSHPAISEIIEMVDKLHRMEMRFSARAYASKAAVAA